MDEGALASHVKAPEQLGELLDAGLAARGARRCSSVRSARPRSFPARQRACRPSERLPDRLRRRRAATTMPAPVSRMSSAAAPSGGTAARIGRSAARYSKTFPRGTPRPRPAASGMSSRLRLGVALELERASVRRRSRSARAGRRGRAPRPTPGRRPEVADEAGDDVVEAGLGERRQERPRVALAEEAARVRDPEAFAGPVSSPAKSSKSEPFAITRPGPSGRSRAPRRR